MTGRPSSQDVVERALSQPADRGDVGRVVIVEDVATANVRWARSTLTTDGESQARGVTVISLRSTGDGIATGVASGPALDATDVDALVAAAAASAASGTPAEDAMPLLGGAPPSADWQDGPGGAGAVDLAVLTPALGDVLRQGTVDGVEWFGYAEHAVGTTYLGTSTGLRLRHEKPATRFELCGKSHGRSRSAWAGRAARSAVGIDVDACASDVRRGLGWQERRVDVPAGRHDVILTPSAVADLLVCLLWSSTLRDAAEGRSVFSGSGPSGTRLGDSLTEVPITIAGDPDAVGLEAIPFVAAAGASAASSVFDNGLSVPATAWVDRGRLASLMTTRRTASTYGVADTPGVDNLLVDVDGATGGVDDVVARTGDGLLVTCLWYIRDVDPQTLLVTGLTRDGVYVVEGGEVVGAAGNYRFNDSPVGMLTRIADASVSRPALPREWADWFTRARTPALRIADFNLSTPSDAL